MKRTAKSFQLIFAIVLFLFQNHSFAQNSKKGQHLVTIGKKDSLYSTILRENRTFYIQYPYDYRPNKRYPVVYILDGEVFLTTVNDVQNYYSGGYTPEMILVGISNDKDRVRDLTPSKISTKYGMPFNEINGEGEKFAQFIAKELIPYIEKTQNTTTYRTLIGHSYGGLFSIFMLLHHPYVFANYLAIDPSLDWDDQKLLGEAKDILSKKDYKNKSLFVSLSGQLHMQDSKITIDNVMQDRSDFTLFARSNISFSEIAKSTSKNGLAFYWKFYPNDIHGTVALPSIMDGLISIYNWYQMENTSKINSFETPEKELLAIIKHREEKLKAHFGYLEPPYPEDLLIMSGYMNMEMQQQEKAKMYLELATQYYPHSQNTWDSLTDYYENIGDFKSAIQCAIKAYELSGDTNFKARIENLRSKDN